MTRRKTRCRSCDAAESAALTVSGSLIGIGVGATNAPWAVAGVVSSVLGAPLSTSSPSATGEAGEARREAITSARVAQTATKTKVAMTLTPIVIMRRLVICILCLHSYALVISLVVFAGICSLSIPLQVRIRLDSAPVRAWMTWAPALSMRSREPIQKVQRARAEPIPQKGQGAGQQRKGYSQR